MPMNLKDYPANWREISLRIRARERGRCKFCGVPNNAYRNVRTGEYKLRLESCGKWVLAGEKVTRIVLTVAHLGVERADGLPGDKHDKMDVRDENLAALCQRCHLAFDREDHVRHRKENREARRLAREPVFPVFGGLHAH